MDQHDEHAEFHPTALDEPAGHHDKGLKEGAINFWDGLAIGVDSTAPAYSLAAVLGSMVVIAGVKAPAVLLVSFIPMFLIAGAFYYMNRADQDCGTTFSWVTRAMGPWMGWMGGWAVFTTGLIVVGAQSDVAAYYIFDLLGMDTARDEFWIRATLAVSLTLLMTWICVVGTELSAKVQRVMVLAQVGAVALFIVLAFIAMARGLGDGASFSISWLNPFGLGSSALIQGMLLGVFMYWGWESAVNLTEESADSETAPGKAAVVSTVILLATYIGTAISVIGIASLATIGEYDDDAGLFGAVAREVMGPLWPLLVISIIISCMASSQTTILPASRTSLSMATSKAFPKHFGEIHPTHGTPAFGTWFIGIASSVWYIVTSQISDNFLYDSLSALSIVVAFYYALTGIRLRHLLAQRTHPIPQVSTLGRRGANDRLDHAAHPPVVRHPRQRGSGELLHRIIVPGHGSAHGHCCAPVRDRGCPDVRQVPVRQRPRVLHAQGLREGHRRGRDRCSRSRSARQGSLERQLDGVREEPQVARLPGALFCVWTRGDSRAINSAQPDTSDVPDGTVWSGDSKDS